MKFRYRFAWARHEEAVHYCPYHWICCLEVDTVLRLPSCFVCGEEDVLLSHFSKAHFLRCGMIEQESRTFLREDQLAQHIQNFHVKAVAAKTNVPKDLLCAWKTKNPGLGELALRCGFCGLRFVAWEQRQEHVFAHMQSGTLKSDWLMDNNFMEEKDVFSTV